MKFRIFISLVILSLALTDTIDSSMQMFNAQNAQCTNKCEACQKAIYQMKFHKVADCGSYHCISTCDTVRSLWGQNHFADFEKDIFGKCEICFRAGFCTISECSDQKQREENIIKQIVNKAHLTGVKKNIVTELGFDKFNKDLKSHTDEEKKELENELEEVKSDVSEGLNASFATHSVEIVSTRLFSTISNLFNPENIYTKTKSEKEAVQPTSPENFANSIKGNASTIESQINELLNSKQMTNELKLNYIQKINGWIKNLNNLLVIAEQNKNTELIKSIKESNFIFSNTLNKLSDKPESTGSEKSDNPAQADSKSAAPSPKKKRRTQKKRY